MKSITVQEALEQLAAANQTPTVANIDINPAKCDVSTDVWTSRQEVHEIKTEKIFVQIAGQEVELVSLVGQLQKQVEELAKENRDLKFRMGLIPKNEEDEVVL